MVIQDPPTIIEVEALSVQYPGRPPVQAVRDVSLTIARQACTGLVGGSGCGKTTLARTLVGLERVTAGRIRYAGADLAAFTAAQRRQYRREVQLVFQDTLGALNPRMRVGRALREVLRVHRRADCPDEASQDELIRRCLDDVELSADVATRFPHEISGGQRQRVGIARAMAVNPRVLIADEPVSALDVAVQAQLLKMLRRLMERTGMTLVLIAHDLAVVRSICDHAIVMEAGRIVDQGNPRELFTHPQTAFTRTLVEAVPDVARALRRRQAGAADAHH